MIERIRMTERRFTPMNESGKALNPQKPESKNQVSKKKKEYDYAAHGIGIEEYIRTPGISDWIKVLHYMLWWYLQPKHKDLVFYQKYSTIKRIFKKWGYVDCTVRNIKEAFRILKSSEADGGVDLISVVYAECSKYEWALRGNNPKKWIFRKVYMKWHRIHKYFSVFATEGLVFKSLRAKSRLKKLVRARQMSYTKHLQGQFELFMKRAKIERYNSAKQMFYGFLYTVSRAFYDVTKLIKNFRPEHTIDLQKEQDAKAYAEAAEKALRGSPSDPYRYQQTKDSNREAPASFKAFVKAC